MDVALLLTGARSLAGLVVVPQRRWKEYRDRKFFVKELGFRPWEDPHYSGNPEIINEKLTEVADEIFRLRRQRDLMSDKFFAVARYEATGIAMAILREEARFLRLHNVAERLGRYLCRGSSCQGFEDHVSPELTRRP